MPSDTIVVAIPEQLFRVLQEIADREGKSVSALLAEGAERIVEEYDGYVANSDQHLTRYKM